MLDDSAERHPVELLAEDFLARERRGERPSLAEYVARYPDLAAEIHELFPVLLDIEDARGDDVDPPGQAAGPTTQPIERLGDYRISREVGRGGMGVVYEAEQESLGRRVALKVLTTTLATPQQVRRFECEARSAARLHHTNIVPVFGVGHERGVHYYVMQFIPGQPLDEVLKEVRRLRRSGSAAAPRASDTLTDERATASEVALTLLCGLSAPVPTRAIELADRYLNPTTTHAAPDEARALPAPAEPTTVRPPSIASSDLLSSSTDLVGSGRLYAHAVARIGVQVADALEYAFEQGIIHRDIKPSNILLDVYGTAWVTDFGLAKVIGQEGLTQSGDLVGTLRYMPPERFRGQADRRGDVYAFGLTLYEMLALRPAFDEPDRARLIRQITDEEPPRLLRLDPSIPRDLATIVHKAMAREPAHRYATAGDLAADLRRFLDDRPIVARRPSLLDRAVKLSRRHRSAVIAGLIGLVVALATLAGSLGWIVRDRGARFELTERNVTRALLEADTFMHRAKWPDALEAVKRAEGFLAVGSSDQLHYRVREHRKDVNMILRLEEIRNPRPGGERLSGHEKLSVDVNYVAAFLDYGIDIESLDPAMVGALIRARSIQRELTAALDHWIDERRRWRASDEASWKRLIAVARAADQDEWRDRLRTALEQGDRATPIRLAESAPVEDLPMQTVELLLPLLDKRHQLSVLRRAQRAHPDDYWMNFKLAFALDYEPPPLQNQDEAIRYYTAALAIRPRHARTHFYLAQALRNRQRIAEAIVEYETAVALEPKATEVLNNLAWLLVTCPEKRLRDPSRALKLARIAVETAENSAPCWNTLGVALYRTGDWNGAITALEKSTALQGYSGFDGFFRAMARRRLGQCDSAQGEYERAVRWMQQVKTADEELSRIHAEATEVVQNKDAARSKTD
jgi:serine/threonine protein kinase/Tfp pilus assembly protein PilF